MKMTVATFALAACVAATPLWAQQTAATPSDPLPAAATPVMPTLAPDDPASRLRRRQHRHPRHSV
ncbi:MAG: hypothetical protein R3E65_10145 [Steroidobacteraceae bacterium]